MTLWREWRGEGPAALFLHGWPMDHRDEAATFDATFARAGYARLYCDLPGMGRSADGPVPHDLDGFLDALTALVAEELGDEPFVLSGTSAGAYLARGLAARLGAQVRGLILRVPLIEPDEDRRDRDPVAPLVRDPALMAAMTAGTRDLLEEPLVETRLWTRDLAAKLRATVVPAMGAADRATLDPIRDDRRRYVLTGAADWPAYDAPALVVTARQDAVVGWRDALGAVSDWPRATVAILDMAGHEVPLRFQQPLFDALVADFLRRLEIAPVPAA